MHAKALIQGDYIAADEFGKREPTFTIASAKLVKMDDEKTKREKNKGVLFFKEIERGWVVNKTNVLLLIAMFGEETDGWIGKQVTLHSQLVDFGSEKKNGIRVKGSPDITQNVTVTVKLPRKSAKKVTLVPTGRGRSQSRGPQGDPPPDDRFDDTPPPPPDEEFPETGSAG